ncbi:MAG: hypothetical protein AMXMBFR46_19390 [Acidimicrobiia bacterium]
MIAAFAMAVIMAPPGIAPRASERPAAEILEQADGLAARFEAHEPDPANVTDTAALRGVRRAFQARADAERRLADAVSVARSEGHSLAAIGAVVGNGNIVRVRPLPGPVSKHRQLLGGRVA